MQNQFNSLDDQYNNKPLDYYSLKRNELLAFLPGGCKNILDVGCSNGAFGQSIKTSRPETVVWGVEPFEEAYLKATEVLDHVLNTTFDENIKELDNKKFDCISFNDVLEHLVNPSGTLELCKKYLHNDGYIIASIPNILFFPVFFNQIILKQDWKYTNAGTLDNTHLRFFTKKSMIRLFEDAGYEIVTIKGINASVIRLYRIINLILLNKLHDWRYLQFAVVARIKK